MPQTRTKHRWHTLWLGSVLLLTLLLAGCGGSAGTSNAGTIAPAAYDSAPNQSSTGSGQSEQKEMANGAADTALQESQGGENNKAKLGPKLYLIKTLSVGMEIKDTKKAADDLLTWISTTDPRAMSTGTNYEQTYNGSYKITMNFSVQAELYSKVYRYLRDYAPERGGRLLTFNETVQDVTTQYVDTESRLKTLRTEYDRLLKLMSEAKTLGDLLAVEQRLTNVQSEIESMQAQLNNLKDQTSFYSITITLNEPYVASPHSPPVAWNVGEVFEEAFAASLAFAQGLVSFVIWLLAFSFYLLPVAALGWFALRWRRSRQLRSTGTTPTPPPATPLD